MVEVCTLATVATDIALSPAVRCVQLAPAMAASEQTGQEPIAPIHRASDHQSLIAGIVGDQALVPLVFSPRDVSVMMIDDQDLPLGPSSPVTLENALASVLESHAAGGLAERVGTRIGGIDQNVVKCVVDRQLPYNPPPRTRAIVQPIVCGRKHNLFLAQPQMHLTNALELSKLAEHEADRFLHPEIRVLLDAVASELHVTH